MKLYAKLPAAFLLVTFAACTSPSHYSLFSRGDTIRYQNEMTAPPSWKLSTLDDTPWPVVAGRIAPLTMSDATLAEPAPVWTRAHFDVGARASAFDQLTLTVDTDAPFIAYLNGTQVATGNGPFSVPPGVLTPADNVMALEVRPTRGANGVDVAMVIDGDPRPVGATPEIIRGPWVLAPTASSVTLVWETSGPVASTVLFDGKVVDGGAEPLHVVTVSDLQSSSAYTYHVEVAGARVTPDAQVNTAANAGERVRFVVYGDNRSDGDAHRRVVQAIENEGADFLLNTGDMIDHESEDEWQTFFNIEGGLLRSTPLWAAPGNHEGASDHFARLFPVGDKSRFAGRAYSADYGDVHVVALDSNSDLAAQATWLDGDLEQARARGARQLFVFMHDGPYSGASGFGSHGSNMVARSFVVPLAKKWNVTAMFAGHDHIYERGKSDDLTYFVTGGGGAPLRGAGSIPETVVSKSLFHYLVVDVAGGTAEITAKDAAGNPFDHVAISR